MTGIDFECQESESGNKPLRQGYRVKLPRFRSRNQTYTFRDERSDELGGLVEILNV